ncbi:shikimate kinase [Olleya sp. Bg11-27]|uniref:shikimate kinase n=1 Tax=Olleya sp. Bg11-27 TaxID=2058135 RepID=UPI000C306EA9|nr:shikimate kinase [Olleya sp. Bg11-27]AUC75913.1 shikimate kinase [Olleya sp. Bg11-27]
MNLILVGYMASGKSTIGVKTAKLLDFNFIDLDAYIEKKENLSVSDIFKTKGELHFRKLEQLYLKEITAKVDKTIISLGGGTPCFYDTMTWLNALENVKTIYLKTSLDILTDRLYKDRTRPLIAHLESKEALKDFIAKHIFERSYFYNQANLVVESSISVKETINTIVSQLV